MNGVTVKDFRVFYSKRDRCWIIANDFKYRRLIIEGYTKQAARDNSHGHLNSKKDAVEIKETILSNKRTKSRELRVLGCYVRVAYKEYKHYTWVCGLHHTKANKTKQSYVI